jgi:putative endonuclease
MVYDLPMNKTGLHLQEVECPERPEEVEGQCFVYLLGCSDDSLYCGSTFDLKNRLKEHHSGEAAAWTRKRRPVQLVYYESHESLLEARRREKQLKGWRIQKKLNLINGIWTKKIAS